MLRIKPTPTSAGGIRIAFMLDSVRYEFAPVLKGRWSSPSDYGIAHGIALQICQDVERGVFDKSLKRYKPQSTAEVMKREQRRFTSLTELWDQYIEQRRGHVSDGTYRVGYAAVSRLLAASQYKTLDEGGQLKLWILSNKPPLYAKRLLVQLNAACKWGIETGLIDVNPFEGFQKMLVKKTIKNEDEIDPFSEDEKKVIISTFREDSTLRHYLNLVLFLFAVGCRPSEAIALTWSDVAKSQIVFNKSYVNGKLNNRLKTQEKRIITQNETVKAILQEQKKALSNRSNIASSLVFPNQRKAGYVDWCNFSQKRWKAVFKKNPTLRYRSPYQMRHTFITNALKVASVQDVAKHCGNSPEVIYRHYAGVSRSFVMPEI